MVGIGILPGFADALVQAVHIECPHAKRTRVRAGIAVQEIFVLVVPAFLTSKGREHIRASQAPGG